LTSSLLCRATPLARTLPSRHGHGTVLGDTSYLIFQIDSTDFDPSSFISLFKHVDRHSPDQEIYTALFALLKSQKLTPPIVLSKLPLDTPSKPTSSSQRADEQTYEDVDKRILQEINGCVF
jgi:hypothetical protein